MDHLNSSYTSDTISSNDNTQDPEPPFDESTYNLLLAIIRIGITGVISVYGIMSNSINIVVFYRQGILSHSCNVSLTGLAVSDFFFCVLTFWGSVCLYLWHFVDIVHYKWEDYYFYTFASLKPTFMFSDITSWVTVFVAVERLISVTFPFRVSAIFTPRRSCVAIFGVFIGIFTIHFPTLFTRVPARSEVNSHNFTILQYKTSGVITRDMLSVCMNMLTLLRIASVTLVILCNIIISWKVIISQKFRKETAPTHKTIPHPVLDKNSSNLKESEQVNSNHQKTKTSYNVNKETKMVRMITVVCTFFTVCYLMDLGDLFVFEVLQTLGIDFNYHWISNRTSLMFVSLFQTINSSCNIFIYYNMSTRYKEVLRSWMCNRKHASGNS